MTHIFLSSLIKCQCCSHSFQFDFTCNFNLLFVRDIYVRNPCKETVGQNLWQNISSNKSSTDNIMVESVQQNVCIKFKQQKRKHVKPHKSCRILIASFVPRVPCLFQIFFMFSCWHKYEHQHGHSSLCKH